MLFINASEHFEKGKRQNYLTDENINKIVDTYQYRKEEERYSRKVSLEEIEKNDFNLNISRYVSTAEPEPIVDLKEVHSELDEINKDIEKFTKEHNRYLEELGIELLG